MKLNRVKWTSVILCLMASLFLLAVEIQLVGWVSALGSSPKHIWSGSGSGSPVELGSLAGDGQNKRFKISMTFCPSGGALYQNLFQTDDVNQGLRAELAGRNLALIIRTYSSPNVPQGLFLSNGIQPGVCHSLEVTAADGLGLSASLDGVSISARNIVLPLSNVRIGIGFDESRRFEGEIRSASVSVQDLPSRRWIWRFVRLMEAALLVAGIVGAGWNMFCFWRDNRECAIQQAAPERAPLCIGVSLMFALMALAYQAIWHLASAGAVAFRAESLLFIAPELPPFKSELIGFVLLSGLSAVFALAVFQRVFLRNRLRHVPIPPAFAIAVAAIELILGLALPSHFSRACLAIAAAASVAVLFVNTLPFHRLSEVTVGGAADHHGDESSVSHASRKVRHLWRNVPLLLFAAALASVAVTQQFQAWFPLQFMPDYFELPVSLRTTTGPQTLLSKDLLTCLPGTDQSISCPVDLPDEQASSMIPLVYNWQLETGRLLFHHSYVVAPVSSLFEHGWSSKIPFLYGFGNSLFSVGMDGATPSLTHYFERVPFVVLTALLCIAALVGFATRDLMFIPVSFLMGLATYFSIDFTAVYLAASFNPSRFIGFALQVASLFYVVRGERSRLFVLPVSLAFSLLWNVEFALIGAGAQILMLFAPGVRSTLKQRLCYGVSIAGLIVISKFAGGSEDIIKTVHLVFFNLLTPTLDRFEVLNMYASLVGAQLVLVFLAFQFTEGERDARLALLPALALLHIKYVLNPAAPHLFVIWIFVLPVLLVYSPWRALFRSEAVRQIAGFAMIAVAGTVAIGSGSSFLKRSDDFKAPMIAGLAMQTWGDLKESFQMAQPGDTIASRVSSLRSHVGATQSTITLSPFDHLLAAYAPPRDVCGHYELLSNMVLRSHIARIRQCLETQPDVVVVYDKALDMDCPTGAATSPLLDRRCTRFKMKANLRLLFAALQPELIKVAEDGDLSYFKFSPRVVSSSPP